MVTNQIKRSEFDSKLLGKEVGKLTLGLLSKDAFVDAIVEFEKSTFDLVLVKSPFVSPQELSKMPWQGLGFQLCLSDIKMDFVHNNSAASVLGPSYADYEFSTEVSSDDIYQIQNIARQIALVSRFAEEFGEGVAIKLYDQWVENLVGKETIYVARDSRDEIAAVAATTKSESSIDLALVSAHPAHSGKGLMKALLKYATAELGKHFNEVTVSTRVNNIPAIKLYEATDFRCCGLRMDWTLTKKL